MHVPQIMPISTLQRTYNAVVRNLPKGPVFLSQHSKPIAVMLSTEDYEKLVADAQEAKRLRRWQKADEAAARMDAGDYTEMTSEEIMAL